MVVVVAGKKQTGYGMEMLVVELSKYNRSNSSHASVNESYMDLVVIVEALERVVDRVDQTVMIAVEVECSERTTVAQIVTAGETEENSVPKTTLVKSPVPIALVYFSLVHCRTHHCW